MTNREITFISAIGVLSFIIVIMVIIRPTAKAQTVSQVSQVVPTTTEKMYTASQVMGMFNTFHDLDGFDKTHIIQLPHKGESGFTGAFEFYTKIDHCNVLVQDFIFQTDFKSDKPAEVSQLRHELFEKNRKEIVDYLDQQLPPVSQAITRYLKQQLHLIFDDDESRPADKS